MTHLWLVRSKIVNKQNWFTLKLAISVGLKVKTIHILSFLLLNTAQKTALSVVFNFLFGLIKEFNFCFYVFHLYNRKVKYTLNVNTKCRDPCLGQILVYFINQVGCLSIFDLNMAWNNPAFISVLLCTFFYLFILRLQSLHVCTKNFEIKWVNLESDNDTYLLVAK